MRKTIAFLMTVIMIACSFPIVGSAGTNLDCTATRWVASELEFTSITEYENPVYTVNMDVYFENTETGTSYTVPAFWNGGKQWICRYALTETGLWKYTTSCTDEENKGLNGLSGTVLCSAYNGNLDIYKHGFVTTNENTRNFVYADGTPFFYLGDVHFSLPMEDIDSYGDIPEELANEKNITSSFKYVIDYRVNQGFTVIQSEPLGEYVGVTGNSWFGDENGSIYSYGVNSDMLEKFKTYDRYFQYIADAGLVHCNTQLSYPEELIEMHDMDKTELEMLCRYWVARYSAYPVLWATVQEGDNDYYNYDGCTVETNPWIDVYKYVRKYDPYKHPSTCHQENACVTRVEESSFKDLEGYSFFAAQYSVDTDSNKNQDFDYLKEYWNNKNKLPVVNYEGRFDHFWIGPKGARSQGWCAYLNGIFGYGYGIQPIWEYFWASNVSGEETCCDETFSYDINWYEGLTSSGGTSMQIMKDFLCQYDWWELTPCFDGNDKYRPSGYNYSFATIGNETYIGYLYNTPDEDDIATKLMDFIKSLTEKLDEKENKCSKSLKDILNNCYIWIRNNASENCHNGRLLGMNNGEYEIKWFNPRTGKYDEDSSYTTTVKNGMLKVAHKPDNEDWVYIAQYVGK